jgi:tetratricopeptide (TPR) repeat protein
METMTSGWRPKTAISGLLTGCLAVWMISALQLYAIPPQGGRAGGNEQQVLKDALGAFADKNIQLARQKAEQIRDAQGSIGEQARNLLKLIDDITEINRKRQNAIIAIQRKNFAAACGLLSEIQVAVNADNLLKSRYPDLGSLKAQAGGCPAPEPPPPVVQAPEPVDTMKPLYNKAVNLMDEGKLPEALRIFKRIQKEAPGYKDVRTLIEELSQEVAGKRAKPEKVSPPERAEVPKTEMAPKTNESRKREEIELAGALNAFYAGRYEQSFKALQDFLSRPHSVSMTSFARFYAGAALGSKYFLSGGKEEAARNDAIQLFQQTIKGDPTFSPRWDTVSPKIKDLFAEATRR